VFDSECPRPKDGEKAICKKFKGAIEMTEFTKYDICYGTSLGADA
jgi:hypothetical protein